jgi:peptidoglycan/LPS O-acetylase OafA/YrhL
MTAKRPVTVVLAVLLVLLQLVISAGAAALAAFRPAEYQTYVVTAPLFLLVLYAVAAYYLWAGRRWARELTLVVALIGVVGNLSVVLYYDDTATVTMNVVGLVIAALIVVLLLAPASRAYYSNRESVAG